MTNPASKPAHIDLIEELRDQMGMQQCDCGRYYDPPTTDTNHCHPCRNQ